MVKFHASESKAPSSPAPDQLPPAPVPLSCQESRVKQVKEQEGRPHPTTIGKLLNISIRAVSVRFNDPFTSLRLTNGSRQALTPPFPLTVSPCLCSAVVDKLTAPPWSCCCTPIITLSLSTVKRTYLTFLISCAYRIKSSTTSPLHNVQNYTSSYQIILCLTANQLQPERWPSIRSSRLQGAGIKISTPQSERS